MMDVAKLQALTPGFDWGVYLRTVGLPEVRTLNVTEPRFYQTLARHWQTSSLNEIKVYLR